MTSDFNRWYQSLHCIFPFKWGIQRLWRIFGSKFLILVVSTSLQNVTEVFLQLDHRTEQTKCSKKIWLLFHTFAVFLTRTQKRKEHKDLSMKFRRPAVQDLFHVKSWDMTLSSKLHRTFGLQNAKRFWLTSERTTRENLVLNEIVAPSPTHFVALQHSNVCRVAIRKCDWNSPMGLAVAGEAGGEQ